MSIIWLASYPKSGNTWVRVFLTNYLQDGNKPADINNLHGGWSHLKRDQFDDVMGLSSSDMTEEELDHYRPAFHAGLVENADPPLFIKSHEAYRRFKQCVSLFAPVDGCKAIHLVRNPLDVAISFAHHANESIDRTIQILGDPESKMSGGALRFVEYLDTWTAFNDGWMDQREIPVLTLRYEDMLADPVSYFTEIVAFSDLEFDEARLNKAISFSSFEQLQKQEEKKGFQERHPAAKSFFRKGQAGNWRSTLSSEQIELIVGGHGACMERLGYEIPHFMAER